jgi:hypothetical protein
MKGLKSLSKMTVTVNGVERPMTEREKRLAALFLFPFVSRHVARELRKLHPRAGRDEMAAILRAELGADPDPALLKLVDMILNRAAPTGDQSTLLIGIQSSPSAWVLALANLIPAWGVLMLGWEVFPLVLLFWLENVIIGALNAARMLCVDPGDAGGWAAKLFMVPFFCFHYGLFTYVHGAFVFALFGGEAGYHTGNPFDTLDSAGLAVAELGLGLPVLALAASHLFSFLWNYILRGEYRTASLSEQMMKPYSRVVALHIGILGGGFLITLLGSPKWSLLLLIVLKTIFDLHAHLTEHRANAKVK